MVTTARAKQPSNNHKVYRYDNDEPYKYSGIDRVNSEKGYVKNNVVPCCKVCNIAKHNMSQNDFFNWINKVYNYTLKHK